MFIPRQKTKKDNSYRINQKKITKNLYPWSEAISDALVVLDKHQQIIHINSVAKKIFEWQNASRSLNIPPIAKNQQPLMHSTNAANYFLTCTTHYDGTNLMVFYKDQTTTLAFEEQTNFFDKLLGNLPFGFLHCRVRSEDNIRLINNNNIFKQHLNVEFNQKGKNIANTLKKANNAIVERITDQQATDPLVIKAANNRTIQLKCINIAENDRICFSEDITDQLASEEARMKSEQRLMLAQRATSDGLIDYDFEQQEFYLSPRIYFMLGYQENVFEPTLENWFALIHPDDHTNIIVPAKKKIYEGQDFLRAEFRMKTNAGRWKWILARGQVTKRDAKGNPLRIIGTHQDISLHKEQTRKVKEQENKLKRFINNIDGMVYRCLYDSHWTMRFVSQGAVKLTGYEPEHLIDNKETAFADIIDYRDKQHVWDSLEAFTSTSKVFDLVYRIRTKTGEVKWVHERGSFVFNKNKISHVEGVILDITKQKQAEEALTSSEKKFRTYIANAPEGILVLNREQHIIEANKAAAQLTEYNINDLCKIQFRKLIHGDQDNSRVFFRLLFEVGYASSEMRIRTGAKKVFYAMISGTKLPDKKYLLFIKDINERKNAELQLQQKNKAYSELNKNYATQNEKLTRINNDIRVINKELRIAKNKAEESEKLKSAFLANISHEIRTPMNGILGFSRLLINPALSIDKRARYIDVIEKSGDQLLALINNILDISKIETDQVQLNYEEVELNELIQDFYTRFKPNTQQKGLDLHLEIPPEGICLYTDRMRLGQIFTNLLTNAIKFTQEGHIKIGYRINSTKIFCFVHDTGPGVSAEQKDKIFERFQQADTGVYQSRGAGLGLAIAKGFTEMLGGQISVESVPGQGATFMFTLPLDSKQGI